MPQYVAADVPAMFLLDSWDPTDARSAPWKQNRTSIITSGQKSSDPRLTMVVVIDFSRLGNGTFRM
jgi:hypothetical protein